MYDALFNKVINSDQHLLLDLLSHKREFEVIPDQDKTIKKDAVVETRERQEWISKRK